jgi:hypothetical protein
MADAGESKSESVSISAESSAESGSSGSSEAASTSDSASSSASSGIAGIIPSRKSAVLLTSLGFAAGIGLLIGTVSVMGIGQLIASSDSAPKPQIATEDGVRSLQQSVSQLEQRIASLKASVDASNRLAGAQRKSISERHEQDSRSQAEIQSRISKIGDAVERLEKRVSAAIAAEATSSISSRQSSASQSSGASRPTTTASIAPPPAAEPPKPAILQGWYIQAVVRGRALVANRNGMFEAAPGLHLPGLGRVDAISKENGRWIVVTEKGIIANPMPPRPRGPGFE